MVPVCGAVPPIEDAGARLLMLNMVPLKLRTGLSVPMLLLILMLACMAVELEVEIEMEHRP